MTADDPRPAGEACPVFTECTTTLPHHTHTDADGRSWCCDPYPYAIRPADRPAASGGATDGEREHRTLVPICSACVALTGGGWQCDPARLACPYWPTGDSDAEPVASQADGELREESVNLTPGTVWTDKQLEVVGALLARAVKAEEALRRVRERCDALLEPAYRVRHYGAGVRDSVRAVRRALDGER